MTLKELEKKINRLRGRPLILLCRTPDGHERKMTVAECVTTGSTFIHVCAGNDLYDLDKLLEYELAHLEAVDTKEQAEDPYDLPVKETFCNA